LEEALELPGVLSDYHFAIQQVCEVIYKGRREDPALLEEVERLCQLDIELVEYYPKTIKYEPGEFPQVLAYHRLITLYEGEGYFREALEVAERSLKMGQENLSQATRLRLVLKELEAEDAGR